MISSYDYRLVALSVVIAMFAAYAALDLAGRTTAARGRERFAWLVGGATAMGIGIWSMHYIGMLAFRLPVPVLYHWPTVLLSLLAAICSAAVALFVVSQRKMGWRRALIGSAVMGSGIATMHYTGMAAMRLPAMYSYDPLLLILSVVLAIAISFVALGLTFHFREDAKATGWWKTGSAIVMGAAIPVMHYTGMAAAQFAPSTVIPDTSHAVSTATLGIAGVSAVTLLVLAVAVLTAAVDRRFSAQALRLDASEQRYRSLVESAVDAIISADAGGHIAYFNPAAEIMFGYSNTEVSGQPLTLLMPERFHAAHRDGLRRFLATREAHVIGKSVELAGRRKNGNEFPLNLSLSAWETGGEIRFTGLLQDITERKRAQEKLVAINQELEAFSYSVAHDLRAPLRHIDGFSKILMEDHGAAMQEEARRLLERIRESAQHMGALIDELLNFSRLGRRELQCQITGLNSLVEEARTALQAESDGRAVEWRVGKLPFADCDPALMKQVFSNLLANALKFTRPREQALIEVGQFLSQGQTVVFVRDNGVGFDMKYADKLFGVFQRLHRPEDFEGTGVGLALVQKIVQKHGGRIWVEAALDRGATFFFTLSAAEAAPQPAAAEAGGAYVG